MTSYTMNFNVPTGTFQRPVRTNQQPNEFNKPHSTIAKEQHPSSQPFFLQRPAVSKELASRLIPIDVDLQTKKNTEEHSTKHYDIPGLVLRRGQSFSFTVTFNRDFNPEENQLFVRLAIGSQSMISKRTQIRLSLDGTPNVSGWSAKSIPTEEEGHDEHKKNNRVSLQIYSPPDAIIGKYTLLLEVHPKKKDDDKDVKHHPEISLFLFEIDLYFLVNPWNKEDVCALSSPEQINEYVMNEHGQIYLGSAEKPQQIPWYFGQFERSALLAAFDLLDKSHLPAQNRTDPSVVLRLLSSKICSNPGTNSGIFPSAFDARGASSDNNGYTSSTAVLRQYLSSNGRSVQGGSGSNWQHAAVLCSLSRALGIPCRIVTVYNAACRADGLETNDIHWDLVQRPLKQLNSDLISSAHVWNECWMGRKDLANNDQDWQVVDSTPALMCDGIRRTGPCSVSSLKKGDLGFRWDSPFVHSSLHGNKSHWLVHPHGDMELLDVQEDTIGTKIITRSLGNEYEPEDITDHYKNTKSSHTKGSVASKSKHDVDIELKLPENIEFGEDIVLELNAKNKSKETRTITTALTICITNNSGQKLLFTYDQPIQTLNLEAEKDGHTQLKISPQQYSNYGKQENINLKYYIHAKVKETDQTFIRDDNVVFPKISIIKPNLDEDVIEIGKPVFLSLQIENTLSRPLTDGHIHIDGLGINQILPINRSFAPKESASLRTQLYPRRVGVGRLYVTFISNTLTSLTQSIPLEIVPEPLKKPDEPLLKSDSEKSPKEEKNSEGETDSQKAPEIGEKVEGKEESQKPLETGEKVEGKDDSQKPLETSEKVEGKDDSQKPPEASEKSEANEEPKKPLPANETSEVKTDAGKTTESTAQSPEKPVVSSPNPSDNQPKEDSNPSPTIPVPSSAESVDNPPGPRATNTSSPNTNGPIPSGSTSSLDKDKMSVDSLDISNDRRQPPNNNPSPNQS